MTKTSFTIICLHVLEGCPEKYRKLLKENEYYFFNDWYHLQDGKVVPTPDHCFERKFFGENISIQAIVGKNGSGKSSILELIYRILNNVGQILTDGLYRGEAANLYFIKDLKAELYYEADGAMGVIECNNDKVSLKWGDFSKLELSYPDYVEFYDVDDEMLILDPDIYLQQQKHKKHLQLLGSTEHLFYSLVLNYSLQSLNPCDYQMIVSEKHGVDIFDSWLNPLYNKNDGYMVPIGFEPYRGGNRIKLDELRDLVRDHAVSLIIDADNQGTHFLPEYSLSKIEFVTNDNISYFQEPNDDARVYSMGDIIDNLDGRRCKLIVEAYELDKTLLEKPSRIFKKALSYLVNKTFNIAETYPGYERFSKLRTNFDYYEGIDEELNETEVNSLILQIKNDPSHIALKVKQTVEFINRLSVLESEDQDSMFGKFTYDWYIRKLYDENKSFESPIDIMLHFPPPIFDCLIYLDDLKGKRKDVPFEKLSSGERQFIYTFASTAYHIRNIASVPEKADRVKYHNVNIFMDEIELCFHPEYQRKFVNEFISMVERIKLNEYCNINVILSTHSPFVLSDIPKSNILFLKDGTRPPRLQEMINPFCANVCDLLHQSFFMEDGFIGDWAKTKVNDLLGYLTTGECKCEWNKVEARKVIQLVGEPLLKGSLMNLYNEKFGESEADLIEWHRQEMERLLNDRKCDEENRN